MSTVRVFHGSDHLIKTPVYFGGKTDNDYGNGFYTTEFETRARSWASLNGNPDKSIVNVYDLHMDELKVLDLNLCGVLAWIAEVVANRGTNRSAANLTGSRIVEMYRSVMEGIDIIKGYRADDSYTQVIEAFLLNQINIAEVERLFYKGDLGNQIFLKSQTAFERIQWLDSYEVSIQPEDKDSDMHARREVNRFLSERLKAILVDGYVVPGITAQYAIQHQLIYRKDSGFYDNTGI